MLKAAESVGVEALTELCNLIVAEGHIPEDWKKSILNPVYKVKGDPMDCGSYRAIKLLEHSMKVVERVLEKKVRKMVNVDEMQCGFTPGKGQQITSSLYDKCKKATGRKARDCIMHLLVNWEPREVTRWATQSWGGRMVSVSSNVNVRTNLDRTNGQDKRRRQREV